MNRIQRLKKGVVPLAVVLLLAGCGGSDGPSAPVSDGLTQMQREDRDASASAPGLFALAVFLISSATSDANEPRVISGITPPAADEAEPSVIPL